MKDFKKLEQIWAAYVYEGRMDPSVQPAVAECWKKCRDAGMTPTAAWAGGWTTPCSSPSARPTARS